MTITPEKLSALLQSEYLKIPTDTEKLEEMRLYFILRTDVPVAPARLASSAASLTWKTLSSASVAARTRYNAYCAAAQPKIALRVKNYTQMSTILTDLQTLRLSDEDQPLMTLPLTVLHDQDGFALMMCVGPVRKSELPKSVQKLQMISSQAPIDGLQADPVDPTWPILRLYFRHDIDIPYGKLAAQAGHAAWSALRPLMATNPSILNAWEEHGSQIEVRRVENLDELMRVHNEASSHQLETSFIVDAGRTAFGEPTPTAAAALTVNNSRFPTTWAQGLHFL